MHTICVSDIPRPVIASRSAASILLFVRRSSCCSLLRNCKLACCFSGITGMDSFAASIRDAINCRRATSLFPFLRLPSHSNKVGAASVLSFSPPPIQGLPGPMRVLPLLFFLWAATPRTCFFAPFCQCLCQCLFHIVPPRFMLTSRSVTQTRCVIRNYPVLECLISIAFLDLVVAPRLSSLCKIRTQDCVLRIQEFEDEAFSNSIPLRLKDLELLHVVVEHFHVH